MPRAYYSEFDPKAAAHLRDVIAAGLVCPGDVDERDAQDIRPSDLDGYDQHHFFAGIGIWSLVLRWAGWPDDAPVWTGSCPCQPFSAAGKGLGFADERHVWPFWHWLIQQRCPDTIFGEQVASADGLAWFDLVSSDLEASGYTVGAADQCSAGVGAPNIRQRLFWVADAGRANDERWRRSGIAHAAHSEIEGAAQQWERRWADTRDCGADGGLVDTESDERTRRFGDGNTRRLRRFANDGRLGNAGNARLPHAEPPDLCGTQRHHEGRATKQSSRPPDPWRELEWIACRDGKQRPTQPGLFPLAARHPGDVAVLRHAGNAINPYVAETFIRAFLTIAE